MVPGTRIPSDPPRELSPEFLTRLESSLDAADSGRGRRRLARVARRIALALVVAAPVIAWRLTLTSPGGIHTAINVLSWLAFLLDVGVHIDTALLTSVNLQLLPSVIGGLLLCLLTAWLLTVPRDET